jgi:membrane protein CcdC involved in cytochrome C biogenesis
MVIIIVISVIAGFLLIVLIVVLVKLKRQKRPQELSTPVVIPLEMTETSPKSHLPTDQVKYSHRSHTIKLDRARR